MVIKRHTESVNYSMYYVWIIDAMLTMYDFAWLRIDIHSPVSLMPFSLFMNDFSKTIYDFLRIFTYCEDFSWSDDNWNVCPRNLVLSMTFTDHNAHFVCSLILSEHCVFRIRTRAIINFGLTWAQHLHQKYEKALVIHLHLNPMLWNWWIYVLISLCVSFCLFAFFYLIKCVHYRNSERKKICVYFIISKFPLRSSFYIRIFAIIS